MNILDFIERQKTIIKRFEEEVIDMKNDYEENHNTVNDWIEIYKEQIEFRKENNNEEDLEVIKENKEMLNILYYYEPFFNNKNEGFYAVN